MPLPQTRLELRRGPWIGEKAAYYLKPGIVAIGIIVDIREVAVKDSPETTKAALIAVLGWPNLGAVPVDEYQEKREGIWHACSHSRGSDVTGACFDCHTSLASTVTPKTAAT